MTVYFSTTINPEGAIYATTAHNMNGLKFLKDGYFMVMLDGHHPHRSLEVLRTEDGVDALQNHCTGVTRFGLTAGTSRKLRKSN